MKDYTYTKGQLWILVVLRLLIGWHFLYEGLVKLWNANWSAAGYLVDSKGIFAKMFTAMAANPGTVKIIDTLNVWGLVLIGLGLLTGFLMRPAIIGGIVLLVFYYLSHPPLIGYTFAMPSEGSYLIVNKNLIEAAALAVLWVFPTSHVIGLDRFLANMFKKPATT